MVAESNISPYSISCGSLIATVSAITGMFLSNTATGISNGRILENLTLAAGKHPRVHIRVPMIGGVNDSEEDVQNFIGFFRKLAGPNVTFEILTYHEYGKNKWEQCGLRYQMWDAHIGDRRAEEARQAFREAGLNYQAT